MGYGAILFPIKVNPQISVSKSFLAGKLKKQLRGKYIVDILLLVFWLISIISGMIALAVFFGESEVASPWGRIHGITARLGLLLVVVHAVQHIPQIKSYIKVGG